MNERLPKFKGEKLLAEIGKSTRGLTYLSETDAGIKPYFGGRVQTIEISHLTGKNDAERKHEKLDPQKFFDRLTKEKDWFGPREKERAKRFTLLKRLLEDNLHDLKVFRIGHIQIDIYVVGIDADGNLAGIKTRAVET
jgi:hypothetical protein